MHWSVNWRRPLAAVLLLGMLGIPPAVQAATPPAHLRAQAALLQFAATHPDAHVQVIVQQQGQDSVNWEIRHLGGRVTSDLPIIHAVAATIRAGEVPALAEAPDVRWVSPDAPVVRSSYTCCSASTLQDVYPQAIGASQLWGTDQGQGIGVAVVDSGIRAGQPDFYAAGGGSRIVAAVSTQGYSPWYDGYGHGTHVAGIIGGDGYMSNGEYIGVAPQVNLINVKVDNRNGGATVATVVNGLQWVYNNQAAYNIRVVNLSLNSTVDDSYQVDPLDAAVETLWQAGIVVVVSAGNNGTTNAGVLFAPANDPFVITVGAVNDQGSVTPSAHTLASFSSYGTVPISTTTGLTTSINKPDLVAPGVNIISDLAGLYDTLAQQHPDHLLSGWLEPFYFRMSGTSMAAPMVSGAVALLLQANPGLTPNQVKYRLMATASPVATTVGVGAGEVNVASAVASTSTASANQGIAWAASIQPGNPAANWTSASWGAASWGSTSWGSASWGTASWGTASWGSASWGTASWGSDYWGS
jgi:serine protease AprX